MLSVYSILSFATSAKQIVGGNSYGGIVAIKGEDLGIKKNSMPLHYAIYRWYASHISV
jgi:hypothetical protein